MLVNTDLNKNDSVESKLQAWTDKLKSELNLLNIKN